MSQSALIVARGWLRSLRSSPRLIRTIQTVKVLLSKSSSSTGTRVAWGNCATCRSSSAWPSFGMIRMAAICSIQIMVKWHFWTVQMSCSTFSYKCFSHCAIFWFSLLSLHVQSMCCHTLFSFHLKFRFSSMWRHDWEGESKKLHAAEFIASYSMVISQPDGNCESKKSPVAFLIAVKKGLWGDEHAAWPKVWIICVQS